MSSAGLYIHFPYCVSICPYCDFDRQATGLASIPRYVAAVVAEIAGQPRRAIHSVFFGGGTPSLMEPSQVGRLLAEAADQLDLLPDAEVTLEANPDECSEDRLAGFRRAGVNRLSIGVQSFDDRTLAVLGRRHSADAARSAFTAARAAGFDDVNLDLMLGLPDMTTGRWLETLDEAAELGPEHLSCYILTIDEQVPMGRDVARGRLRLPDDEAISDQYIATQERLAAAGYERYEISNWARQGRGSRHNLTYWRDEPYIGVGAGAAGWLDGVRTKNTPSPSRYMASIQRGRAERIEEERPDRLTQMRDFLALGLRTREGIDPARFERRFGVSLCEVLGATLTELVEENCLEWHAGRLRVVESRILVTNEVMLRLSPLSAPRRGGGGVILGDPGAQPPAQVE
ncbi:MAG TPA: radical SAM family heme chaperone HemW [Chloroflexota bacterium]|nr:radical SAM family heme chaperone HemW [Chloroflexota bacterium]